MFKEDISSVLKKSFNVLNALLWPIIVLAFFDAWGITTSFNVPQPLADRLFWPEFILKTCVKCAITAFAYGLLSDLLYRKETFQSSRVFFKYIRKSFIAALLLFFLPYLVHFFIFISIGKVPFQAVDLFLQPLLIILWINHIRSKEDQRLISTGSFDLKKWCIFGGLTFLSYSINAGLFLLPATWSISTPTSIFITQYIQFFFFIVVLSMYSRPKKPQQEPNEIILINPHWSGILPWIVSLFFGFYPLFFIVLKALTPKKYTFKEFNRVLWRDDLYCAGRLVAITTFTSNSFEAYAIAKKFKQKGSKVVMGGPHVTAFPHEALEFCDAVVVGPAEGVWGRVINDYESGTLQGIYSAPATQEGYEKTIQLLKQQAPGTIASSLETVRGCKFNCYFCGGGHAKTGYYSHPMDDIVDLIRTTKRRSRSIFFIDDNIFSDPVHAKELFRKMKPLKIRWTACSSVDIAKDPEALTLCKESGCFQLLIGYETFPGSTESKRDGKFSMAHEYMSLSRKIKKAGIQIKAHFIYGFETDGFVSFWRLWWFALRLFPTISVLSLLTPMPNSRFYKEMNDQDRIINLNWTKYSVRNLVFSHQKINNVFFRDLFFFCVQPFFILTTSFLGMCLLTGLFLFFRRT